MIFYLGTHQPAWLGRLDLPLFISHRRLSGYRSLPVARFAWALDSGAFSELSQFGRWTFGPELYVATVRRYAAKIGRLAWVAPQDWMCEPFILAKTGLSVRYHLHRTVANYCTLLRLAPELSFIPVLQGWTVNDYMRCFAMYRANGIDLTKEALVGLGSICRRQSTDEIAHVVMTLANLGLRLHGFGVKQPACSATASTSRAPTVWRGASGAGTLPAVHIAHRSALAARSPRLIVSRSPWNGANAC